MVTTRVAAGSQLWSQLGVNVLRTLTARCTEIVYVNVQFKVHMCMAVPFVHGLRKFEGESADTRDASGVSLNKVSLTQICVNGG